MPGASAGRRPDGAHVGERDDLEMLGGTLPARIRTTLHHLEPMLALPEVELRLHNVHLYNAIYRFDDEMIVTPYLYGAHGYQHPALHPATPRSIRLVCELR